MFRIHYLGTVDSAKTMNVTCGMEGGGFISVAVG